MEKRIQLLDCTLRDGGFGLEDAIKNGVPVNCFDGHSIEQMIENLKMSKIDIIELGAIEITEEDKTGMAIYKSIEHISQTIPDKHSDNQMYAALFRGPDTPMEAIPEWCEKYCEGIRVIIRYSELEKSLQFCKGLAQKGYKVFVQPMLTMRYTEEELQLLIDAANDMGAYALYFVDSYGYMQQSDVERLFRRFDLGLHPDIRIGFHAHNNMNLAFSNTIFFMKQSTERNIIVDSCALGMGQGAGNLQTELIVDYMNRNYGLQYDYTYVLETCEIVEKFLVQNVWGYSVVRVLPAIHKTAYKYAVAMRNKYGMSYSKINTILQDMPDELRHRYTVENLEELVEMLGGD